MDQIVDVNVTLGHWPFRRVPGDEPAELVERLKSQGVVQAWAGTFEGVFHRDLASANERLMTVCQKTAADWLLPFGSVNPLLPDWEEDLRRCAEQFKMPGIRLHPTYHGYRLDDPLAERLLALAAERNLVVQVVATLEDERTQSHLARVPHLDLTPLKTLLPRLRQMRLVVLNAFRGTTIPQAAELMTLGQIWFDIAMLESAGGVGNLVERSTAERVLFGSHFPLFYFESALLKMRESELAAVQRRHILQQNSRDILSRR